MFCSFLDFFVVVSFFFPKILTVYHIFFFIFPSFFFSYSLDLTESHFAVTLNSKRTKLIRSNNLNVLVSEINGGIENGGGEDSMIDLSDYIDRSTLNVQIGFPMSKVYTLFRSLGLRHLCVVNPDGECVGILTRKELMCAFDRDLM